MFSYKQKIEREREGEKERRRERERSQNKVLARKEILYLVIIR